MSDSDFDSDSDSDDSQCFLIHRGIWIDAGDDSLPPLPRDLGNELWLRKASETVAYEDKPLFDDFDWSYEEDCSSDQEKVVSVQTAGDLSTTQAVMPSEEIAMASGLTTEEKENDWIPIDRKNAELEPKIFQTCQYEEIDFAIVDQKDRENSYFASNGTSSSPDGSLAARESDTGDKSAFTDPGMAQNRVYTEITSLCLGSASQEAICKLDGEQTASNAALRILDSGASEGEHDDKDHAKISKQQWNPFTAALGKTFSELGANAFTVFRKLGAEANTVAHLLASFSGMAYSFFQPRHDENNSTMDNANDQVAHLAIVPEAHHADAGQASEHTSSDTLVPPPPNVWGAVILTFLLALLLYFLFPFIMKLLSSPIFYLVVFILVINFNPRIAGWIDRQLALNQAAFDEVYYGDSAVVQINTRSAHHRGNALADLSTEEVDLARARFQMNQRMKALGQRNGGAVSGNRRSSIENWLDQVDMKLEEHHNNTEQDENRKV